MRFRVSVISEAHRPFLLSEGFIKYVCAGNLDLHRSIVRGRGRMGVGDNRLPRWRRGILIPIFDVILVEQVTLERNSPKMNQVALT